VKVGDLVRFKPHCEVQGLAVLLQSVSGDVEHGIVRVQPTDEPHITIVASTSNLELVSESR